MTSAQLKIKVLVFSKEAPETDSIFVGSESFSTFVKFTHKQSGIESEIMDLLQGRVPKTTFARHYQSISHLSLTLGSLAFSQ